jgi:hypothetical protein
METNNQAGLMRLYFLGLLTESEQIALEEQFFEDGGMLGEMRAVEQDLVDAYVRGRLREDEKTNFERHYLSVPRHAERVAFARDLLQLADAEPVLRPQPAHGESREPLGQKWLSFFQMPKFAMGATLAMIAILVFSGLYLFRERARWQEELAKAQAEQAPQQEKLRALEREIAKGRTDVAQLSAELERFRQQQRTTERAAPATIFSFLLLPTSRGDVKQQTLPLTPNAAQIRLQMEIAAGEYKSYHVRLKSVDSDRTWESTAVRARPADPGLILSILVPSRKLSPGDYTLDLSGIETNGASVSLENYSFRVTKP